MNEMHSAFFREKTFANCSKIDFPEKTLVNYIHRNAKNSRTFFALEDTPYTELL